MNAVARSDPAAAGRPGPRTGDGTGKGGLPGRSPGRSGFRGSRSASGCQGPAGRSGRIRGSVRSLPPVTRPASAPQGRWPPIAGVGSPRPPRSPRLRREPEIPAAAGDGPGPGQKGHRDGRDGARHRMGEGRVGRPPVLAASGVGRAKRERGAASGPVSLRASPPFPRVPAAAVPRLPGPPVLCRALPASALAEFRAIAGASGGASGAALAASEGIAALAGALAGPALTLTLVAFARRVPDAMVVLAFAHPHGCRRCRGAPEGAHVADFLRHAPCGDPASAGRWRRPRHRSALTRTGFPSSRTSKVRLS